MADIEISGECSSHISVKSKGNNDVTICKKCSEYKTQLKEVLGELIYIRMINELHQKELLSCVTSVSTWRIVPDSADNNVQPFGNWPLRHSSKMSYLEVAANKPYTVTKNRFQLLNNLQVEDSPKEVPSKTPQPGKSYSSAVRVRSARVKGERQVTKVINKTQFLNANAIPVIVSGQAPTSKSNPAQRQSSKSSHRKDHKVLIIGDSHTRHCATNVKSEIKDNYDVQGLVKLGAGASILMNSVNSEIASLTKIDVVVLCGGANDVSKNNSKMALRHIRNFIKTNNHTNIILVSAPHRYNLMKSSCVSSEIKAFNRKLMKSIRAYKYASVLEMSTDSFLLIMVYA